MRRELAAAEQLLAGLRESQYRRGAPREYNAVVERVIRMVVLRVAGTTVDLVKSRSKDRAAVLARRMALHVYRAVTRQGYSTTARAFFLDHSTVMKAERILTATMVRDASVAATVNEIVAAIRGEAK